MSSLYKEKINQFPIRTPHLRILAAATAGPVRARDVAGLAPSTLRRSLKQLVEMQILTPGPRRGLYHLPLHGRVAEGAREALRERSDLPELLDNASTLPTLASLMWPTVGPWPRRCSGTSAPTYRKCIDRLQRRNIIQKSPGGGLEPNRGLAGLRLLLLGYQDLQTWLPPASAPHVRSSLAIHQRGIETAWRLEDVRSHQMQPIATPDRSATFAALDVPFLVAYRGPRQLDPLDHALLLTRAVHRLHATQKDDHTNRLEQRMLALLAAGTTHEQTNHRRVSERFRFYGLQRHLQELRTIHKDHQHPMMPAVQAMREAGVPEGGLAR